MAAPIELIPRAQSLSRVDKLRLIQLLAEELASNERNDIKAKQAYAAWSPDSAFAAADIMLQALANEAHSCLHVSCDTPPS
jgi:hypothetical protein